MNKVISTLICLFFIPSLVLSYQLFDNSDSGVEIYLDAVVFNSGRDTLGNEALSRVDVYTLVPFQALNFVPSGEFFVSKYNLYISIYDTSGTLVQKYNAEKKLVANSFFESQGGNGKFDNSQNIFYLAKGKYKVNIDVEDSFSKSKYNKSRTISSIDFNAYPFSISGLMILSSIEEVNGKYKITPHISDNVSGLQDNYFVFFESYNNAVTSMSKVDFVYEIIDAKSNVVFKSERITKEIPNKKNQHFIKINPKNKLSFGNYILRISVLKNLEVATAGDEILAVGERSVNNRTSLAGLVFDDLDNSIRQLVHIATQQEMDFIKSATEVAEKERRFAEFWKKVDPTPFTEKNEAFDEYYNRVRIANAKFKTFTDGFLTDRGKVFIVLGVPQSMDNTVRQSDGMDYQRWVYSNNREFIFQDRTGFGDFRLFRPYSFNEMYQFKFN